MRTLRRARLFMLAAMLVAGLSCSTDQPTTPLSTPETPDQLLGGLSGLLSCTPLPADSAEQTVGPEGGTIAVGPHTLVVPAGALNQETVITATVPSDSVNSVILGPQGLTFAPGKPARLTLSYANCSLVSRVLPKRIAYTTDELEILQLLPSLDDLLHLRVSAPLQHFSRYAVSY